MLTPVESDSAAGDVEVANSVASGIVVVDPESATEESTVGVGLGSGLVAPTAAVDIVVPEIDSVPSRTAESNDKLVRIFGSF